MTLRQPQLYLLRWLRLLFGREFHLSDSMLVWDALFAYGRGLELVEHMAVAMLLYVRASLLDSDYTSTLRPRGPSKSRPTGHTIPSTEPGR